MCYILKIKIVENPNDEKNEEVKIHKISEEMRKSIFFNDYSKTFKIIEFKINDIVEKIQRESNARLIPLITDKDYSKTIF